MAGHLRHGTVLTPASHASVDKFRIASQTRIGADSQTFGDTGTETFNKCIGLLDKTKNCLDAIGVLEIDPNRATTAIHHVFRRSCWIAAVYLPGAIDADDVGAHVSEHHRREWSWPNTSDLNDSYARERSHKNCSLTWKEVVMRWHELQVQSRVR